MAMAVAHQNFPGSPILFFNGSSDLVRFQRQPPHLAFFSKPLKPLAVSATPPSTFLSHLYQNDAESSFSQPHLEQGEDAAPRQEDEEEEEEAADPIVRFFKSRSSTQDPQQESRFVLKANCSASWRLSPTADFSNTDEDVEPDALLLGFNQPNESTTKTLLEEEEEEKGLPAEILKIAKELPPNSTLAEFLLQFQGIITPKECLQVLSLLGQQGLVRCCLYFFEWMGLQEPSLVTSRAYSIVFPLLGRSRMGDQLMTLFDNLPNKKEFRDVCVYNSAISGLMASGRYDDAWKVYEAMEANNVLPDHVTCSIVITVMRKNRRSAKDVWELFEKMNRKGVKWSSEVVGALIKSFCDEGLKKEALIIQSEMERKGVAPNVIIYNTLMDAYTKSNQIEEAEALFAELKAKGLKPSSATFNILMDAYSRRMQPEIVENLLVEMKSLGLQPSATSYTCLISAYGRQRKMSETDLAADAFLRMRKDGIKPNLHSYTALIHAYSVSGWDSKAYSAFENMQREGIRPSIETYTTMLDAFRRVGDMEMLRKIWKMMNGDKIEGTQVTFNILLDGFAKQGLYMEARDVVSEFGNIGLQPTVMTYNMLMNAYARGGQHMKLPQLLKEMGVLNLKPDHITYSTMIYAYVRVRDFRRAFVYHKEMVKSGQVPDAKSYEKLRAMLDKKAVVKNRKDKKAILGIVNSKMGSVKLKKKGKKDEFWKNHNRVRSSIPVGSRRVDGGRDFNTDDNDSS